MDELRAICARLAGNELVAAECENLTGGRPGDQGVATCQTLDGVPRSAYILSGIRCIAQGESLAELSRNATGLSLRSDRFQIEVLCLSPCLKISKQEAILALANSIDGSPDLDNPRHRFKVVVQGDGLWFGEVLTGSQHTYRIHDAKPYRTTNSLPSRLARALVNLVSPPASSILDPFCGTGSILLEACAMGMTAYGVDINPKMAGMTLRNLAHYGYQAEVERGDAMDYRQTAEAIVTDLPYGRTMKVVGWQSLLAILQHAVHLAPLAVYLAEQDISALLLKAGYANVEVFCVSKRAGMKRYVHRARSSFW